MNNTIAVVSGIGDRETAYCVQIMKEMSIMDTAMQEKLVGEYLYHCFGASGQCLQVGKDQNRVHVKKEILETDTQESTSDSPILATLLKFEDWKGRPATNKFWKDKNNIEFKRYVIAVAVSNENTKAKAISTYVLLKHRLLTHVCIPSVLAKAILTEYLYII